MELSCNWQAFQGFFQPDAERRRSLARVRGAPSLSGRVFIVKDGERALSVFSDCPALSRECQKWAGRSITEIEAAFPGRELAIFESAQVDQWLSEATPGSHVLEQYALFRDRASNSAGGLEFPRHFLLEGLETWWNRVLPSTYGILIRISAEANAQGRGRDRSLLVIVRRGKIEAYDEPDLSSLGPERARNTAEVVRHVSERYRVPVQGLFVSEKDWNDWSQGEGAWKKVAAAIKREDAKLVPFRMSLASLIATRAYLGL